MSYHLRTLIGEGALGIVAALGVGAASLAGLGAWWMGWWP